MSPIIILPKKTSFTCQPIPYAVATPKALIKEGSCGVWTKRRLVAGEELSKWSKGSHSQQLRDDQCKCDYQSRRLV